MAIVALIVTLGLALRADRRPEITLRVLSSRPLLTADAGVSGISITLDDAQLVDPWLASMRLENSGRTPIRSEDVEVPVSIGAASGRLIDASITERSDPALVARLSTVGGRVILNHGLLNPGDWLSLDALYEGEPSDIEVSARVVDLSGGVRLVETEAPETRVFAFEFPWLLEILFLVIASGITLAVIVFSIQISFGGVAEAFKPPISVDADRLESLYWEGVLNAFRSVPEHGGMTELAFAWNLAWRHLEPRAFLRVLADDPDRLEEYVLERLPGYYEEATGVAPEVFAQELIACGESIRESVVRSLSYAFPYGVRDRLPEELSELPLDRNDLRAGMESFVAVVQKRGGGRRSIQTDDLAAGMLILSVGILMALIVGGAWMNSLSR